MRTQQKQTLYFLLSQEDQRKTLDSTLLFLLNSADRRLYTIGVGRMYKCANILEPVFITASLAADNYAAPLKLKYIFLGLVTKKTTYSNTFLNIHTLRILSPELQIFAFCFLTFKPFKADLTVLTLSVGWCLLKTFSSFSLSSAIVFPYLIISSFSSPKYFLPFPFHFSFLPQKEYFQSQNILHLFLLCFSSILY